MLRPLAVRLGWDAHVKEEPNAATLRDTVLAALSRLEDRSVIAEARRRFDIAQRSPQEFSPTVRPTALSIVARHADAETLDRLITLLRATRDPLEKQNTVEAMAGIADPSGAQRVLDLAARPDAPAGTAARIVFYVSREHPDLAWDFALQHVDKPDFPIDSLRHPIRPDPHCADRPPPPHRPVPRWRIRLRKLRCDSPSDHSRSDASDFDRWSIDSGGPSVVDTTRIQSAGGI
jgi:aminopeptidase N